MNEQLSEMKKKQFRKKLIAYQSCSFKSETNIVSSEQVFVRCIGMVQLRVQ